MVLSHPRFITRELLNELKLQKKWVQIPFLYFSFHVIVHAIADVNAPT